MSGARGKGPNDGRGGSGGGRSGKAHGHSGGVPANLSESASKYSRYKSYKNLFERFDIDPRQGPRAITERLRELAEETTAEAERAELRTAWEELTLHPIRRLRVAFGAHPESRPPLGIPPSLGRKRGAAALPDLTLSELLVRPSVARALGGGASVLGPPRDGHRQIPGAASPADNLDDDPILKRVPDVR
jgi:hypothetical protein